MRWRSGPRAVARRMVLALVGTLAPAILIACKDAPVPVPPGPQPSIPPASVPASAVAATAPATPVAESPQAALRQALSAHLSQPAEFQAEMTNSVQQDGVEWVFLVGRPLRADGGRLDYAATAYAAEVAAGGFEDRLLALLRRQPGDSAGWQVLELSLGAADAPFVDWFERHGLPLSLASPR